MTNTKPCTVVAAALAAALKTVRPFTGKTEPILAMTHMAVSDGLLRVSNTCLDVMATAIVPCEGDMPAFAVDGRKLAALLRNYPAGEAVALLPDLGNAVLRIRAQDEEFRIEVLRQDEWPKMTRPQSADVHGSIQVDAGFVGDVFGRLLPFVSTEETRYYLNGINLQSDGDHIVAASTDGHRLGRIRRAAAGAEAFLKAGPESCIIRRRAIVAAVALLRGPVTIHLSKHRIEMSCPVGVVTSTLIDGTFPAYGKLIPDHGACGYEADRKALLSAVAKLSAVSDGQDGMSLAWDGRQLVGEVTIGVHGIGGRVPVSGSGALTTWPKTSLGISRRYLASIASVLRGAALQITAGAQRHAPFVISDPSDSDVLFLLMSMTVDAAKRHVAPSAQVGTLEAAE